MVAEFKQILVSVLNMISIFETAMDGVSSSWKIRCHCVSNYQDYSRRPVRWEIDCLFSTGAITNILYEFRGNCPLKILHVVGHDR